MTTTPLASTRSSYSSCCSALVAQTATGFPLALVPHSHHHDDDRTPPATQRRKIHFHKAFSSRRPCRSVLRCLRWPWSLSTSVTKFLTGPRWNSPQAARPSSLPLRSILLTTYPLISVAACIEYVSSMDGAAFDTDRKVSLQIHRRQRDTTQGSTGTSGGDQCARVRERRRSRRRGYGVHLGLSAPGL